MARLANAGVIAHLLGAGRAAVRHERHGRRQWGQGMRRVLGPDAVVAAMRSPSGASAPPLGAAPGGRVELLSNVAPALDCGTVCLRGAPGHGAADHLLGRPVHRRHAAQDISPVASHVVWRPPLRDRTTTRFGKQPSTAAPRPSSVSTQIRPLAALPACQRLMWTIKAATTLPTCGVSTPRTRSSRPRPRWQAVSRVAHPRHARAMAALRPCRPRARGSSHRSPLSARPTPARWARPTAGLRFGPPTSAGRRAGPRAAARSRRGPRGRVQAACSSGLSATPSVCFACPASSWYSSSMFTAQMGAWSPDPVRMDCAASRADSMEWSWLL